MSITKLIAPHLQDLGGFNARRSLPQNEQMMVGPFIFFDHLGAAEFPAGKGVDVRPHPHINLATVTYLLEGVLLHQDSLGYTQEILPGAVNWMTAGKGIVHSERSPKSDRESNSILHAIQTWVALPESAEEVEPSFTHYTSQDIPNWKENGVKTTLIAGETKGYKSPVKSYSPIIYLDLSFSPQGKFKLSADWSERAVYTITEGITINGKALPQHRLAVLNSQDEVKISATQQARCMVIGGEPVGKRYKWWNFVSSSVERIEKAKKDWRDSNFAQVPGETEFIPLPEKLEMMTQEQVF